MRTQRIDQEIFDILERQFNRGKGESRHEKSRRGLFRLSPILSTLKTPLKPTDSRAKLLQNTHAKHLVSVD